MIAGAGKLKDAFRGALLGTFVGDALGAPVEGWSAARIAGTHGEVREMLPERLGRGCYTDDTEMMILLAEALLASEEFEGIRFARLLVEKADPGRGYGRGTTDVIRRLRAGTRWDAAAEQVFPRGSFGNGGAIRAAPVGLLHHHDPDRVGRVAEDTALVTHAHPLGVAGTILQAQAVALAVRCRDEGIDPIGFAVTLRSIVSSGEFRHKLRAVEACLEKPVTPKVIHDRLGANSTALGSVPTAIWAFLSQVESFEDAVVQAVALGGDTDSIAAMTGAIAGAYHGAAAIPRRWREVLEDGERGATYVEELAGKLVERHVELRKPYRLRGE